MVRSVKTLGKTGFHITRNACFSIIVLILICSPLKPVYGSTPNDNLTVLKSPSIAFQDEANLQLQLEAAALTQAQSIQESIDVLKGAIDQNNLVIEQHKKNIADLEAEQKRLADEQKKDTETLGSYVKDLYTDGDTPVLAYVSWLVNSTSFGDLINRYSYADTILSFYRDLRAKIAANSDSLSTKRSLEQAETTKLTDEVTSKQQLLDGLTVALAKQNEFLKSMANDPSQTMQTLSRGQQTMSESDRLIAAEQMQAQLANQAKYQQLLASQLAADSSQGTLNAPVKLDGQVGQLLSFASTFLGVPYTWGGTYPQFDCSSYVQYVYGHFGVKLNRVTWDQYNEGQSISRDSLQAGDLVFFSTYQAGPSHVGIYIGNGIMINSSNSGVSYASINSQYWSSRYYGARRVIAQ